VLLNPQRVHLLKCSSSGLQTVCARAVKPNFYLAGVSAGAVVNGASCRRAEEIPAGLRSVRPKRLARQLFDIRG
jgi:hypothetical protein